MRGSRNLRMLLCTLSGTWIGGGLIRGLYGPLFHVGIGMLIGVTLISLAYEHEIDKERNRTDSTG